MKSLTPTTVVSLTVKNYKSISKYFKDGFLSAELNNYMLKSAAKVATKIKSTYYFLSKDRIDFIVKDKSVKNIDEISSLFSSMLLISCKKITTPINVSVKTYSTEILKANNFIINRQSTEMSNVIKDFAKMFLKPEEIKNKTNKDLVYLLQIKKLDFLKVPDFAFYGVFFNGKSFSEKISKENFK